jgi:hypothetical protein
LKINKTNKIKNDKNTKIKTKMTEIEIPITIRIIVLFWR